MPFRAEDIVRNDGMTVEKLNRSIPVSAPWYFAVNRRAGEKEKKLAYGFLLWLNRTPAGLLLTGKNGLVPYDPGTETLAPFNALAVSLLGYVKSGDIIPAACRETVPAWGSEEEGPRFMEAFLSKPGWTETDYRNIADFAIREWIRAKEPQ
jgi:hypothetical protein